MPSMLLLNKRSLYDDFDMENIIYLDLFKVIMIEVSIANLNQRYKLNLLKSRKLSIRF